MYRLVPFLLISALGACDTAVSKTDALRYDALAAAKADGPAIVGALSFAEPANGKLAKATPRQTWTLEVGDGAVVDLEITHGGTSAKLDTVLIVVGPVVSDAAVGPVVAEDDDSGWGLHSKIRGLTLTGGRYLVTVQSYDGVQAGSYRLVTRCGSPDACTPRVVGVAVDENYCHPRLAKDIAGCIDEQLADVDRDPTTWTALDVGRSCADAEPVADVHDAVCADERPAPSWCGLDYEGFVNAQLALCEDDAVGYAMRQECTFGSGYGDLAGPRLAHLSVSQRRVIDLQSQLDTLEAAQLVAAVRVAYEDAADVASALDAVDGGSVNQLHVWDASSGRGYVTYEYGAGDNSYGAILAEGATVVTTEIHDGDYAGCPARGPELGACSGDAQCTSGQRCIGVSDGRGRCVTAREYPGDGDACHATSADDGCGVARGLVCAGVGADGDGMCMPAWQRNRFSDWAVAHIPAAGKVERTLTAWGLTTVSTDVAVGLQIAIGRPQDLRITLTNPATTVGVVWDYEAGAAGELELARAIRAFPGDESANGAWTLTIENRGTSTGTLVSWDLTVMSRWD